MAGYIGTQPVPQATQTRDAFTATNNQTSFPTSGYTPEFLDVFLNGVKLAASDYTATNGSDVVLAVGATTSDILEVVAYSTFEVLNPTFDGNVTFTGNASFGDNDKAIFGDGSDLQIYHDGSKSVIEDSGTGALQIKATDLEIRSSTTNENYIYCVENGAVNLYYNDAQKLATTSTGIDVTGGITTDAYSYLNGLRIAGADTGNTVYQQSGDLSISSASGSISLKPSGTNILHATNTGVGIGTSSPTLPLDIVSNSGADALKIRARPNGNDYGTLTFYNNAGTTKWADIQSNVAKDLRFYTNGGVEAMRIDSSGNVLVAKTSSSAGTVGHELLEYGRAVHTVDASTVQVINRLSNDGDMTIFQKDGTTVGSIGTQSGKLQIDGSSGTGFWLDTTQILPKVNSSLADNQADLGSNSYRFKDAYLSGGIYLGGTGLANKLDDYEQSTFTPEFYYGSWGYNTQRGDVIRIGNFVQISILVSWSSSSSTGDPLVIQLPISSIAVTNARFSGCLGYVAGFDTTSSSKQINPVLSGNSISLNFYRMNDNAPPTFLTNSSCSSSGEVQISISYTAQ